MKNVILLHGALETKEAMRPLEELLASNGFTCHRLTFQGHGRDLPLPTDFRIKTFAEDLDQYLRQLGQTEVTVCGHSMGGYVALVHLARYKDSPIKRVICYGTKFDWSEEQTQKLTHALEPQSVPERVAQFMESQFGVGWASLMRRTSDMMVNIARLDALTSQEMGGIKVPVALVIGDQERIVTVEETQRVADLLPQARMHVLSQSRHEMDRCDLAGLVKIIL